MVKVPKLKLILLMVFILEFIAVAILLAQNKKIPAGEISTNSTNIFSLVSYGNKVASWGALQQCLSMYDGNNWRIIPLLYKTASGNYDTIKIKDFNYNPIEFDPEGNLWFCGLGGYFKLTDEGFVRYGIDDSLEGKRMYTKIRFDSLGNIWLTTRVRYFDSLLPIYKVHWVNDTTFIIKYDGHTYKVMAKEFWDGWGITNGFVATKDGKIIVQYYKGTSKLPYLDSNLVIFNGSGVENKLELPTPRYLKDSSQFQRTNANISQILEDNLERFWFALGRPLDIYSSAGLVRWNRKDNLWKGFTKEEGYPGVPRIKGTIPDTFYLECNGICQDNANRIWIAGRHFIAMIDSNDKVVPPNLDDFMNGLVFYPSSYWDDTLKRSDAYQSYKEFLRDSLFFLFSRLINPWEYLHNGSYTSSVPQVLSMTFTKDKSLWFSIFYWKVCGILRYTPTTSDVVKQLDIYGDGISIYPQPVNLSQASFTIKFAEPVSNFSIVMYDVTGKKVFENDFTVQSQTEAFSVDVSSLNLSSGSYFVMIELQDRIVFKKIIVY